MDIEAYVKKWESHILGLYLVPKAVYSALEKAADKCYKDGHYALSVNPVYPGVYSVEECPVAQTTISIIEALLPDMEPATYRHYCVEYRVECTHKDAMMLLLLYARLMDYYTLCEDLTSYFEEKLEGVINVLHRRLYRT